MQQVISLSHEQDLENPVRFSWIQFYLHVQLPRVKELGEKVKNKIEK